MWFLKKFPICIISLIFFQLNRGKMANTIAHQITIKEVLKKVILVKFVYSTTGIVNWCDLWQAGEAAKPPPAAQVTSPADNPENRFF
jgi:hypothetical protein